LYCIEAGHKSGLRAKARRKRERESERERKYERQNESSYNTHGVFRPLLLAEKQKKRSSSSPTNLRMSKVERIGLTLSLFLFFLF